MDDKKRLRSEDLKLMVEWTKVTKMIKGDYLKGVSTVIKNGGKSGRNGQG